MRSRQSDDKRTTSASRSPLLQRAPTPSLTRSDTLTSHPPSAGLNASFAHTPVSTVQRAPMLGGFGGQTDLSLAAPTARPSLAPTIQRKVDDPDGSIRKKFVTAAKAGGLRAYDVGNAKNKLTQILNDNDLESDAWDDWVNYWKTTGPQLCHKTAKSIEQKMNASKEKQEKINQEIGELVFDEVEQKQDKGKQTVWEDEEDIEWDKESFDKEDLDYEKQLETHYPLLQDLSERVLWQMYEEEGFLTSAPPEETELTGEEGKKEKEETPEVGTSGSFSFTNFGQQTLNKAIVKSQKKEGMDVSRLEQSFIFNNFKCPKSGSIKTRSNKEREYTTLNYQEGRDLKSQGIPGIGTYDNHLGRLNDKAREGGLELKDLFQDMEGSHEERVTKMKKRVSLKLPKLGQKKLNEISETLVKEEDKTGGLNELEQDRSYRDCLATSTSFEGTGSLWPPTTGLKTLNPMYHEGATTASIKEQKGETLTKEEEGDRSKTVKVAKTVLKTLIDKTMDEKFKPSFQRRTGLFRRGKALKKFLQNPNDKEANEQMENEVRRLYHGKRKRTNSNPGATQDVVKKKKEDEDN